MARVYNFSAGPSMLPESVLRTAQAEMLEYGSSGQSVMEMSHRSVLCTRPSSRRPRPLCAACLQVPDNYKMRLHSGRRLHTVRHGAA